jgi:CHAT domain-containing protein
MRAARIGGAGTLLIVAALAIRHGEGLRAGRSARSLARAHFISALERRAHFDAAGAMRDLRAAWTADPTYLPAFHEAVFVADQMFLPPALVRELDSLAGAQPDSVLGRCLRSLLAVRNGAWAPIDLPRRASTAARTCVAHFRFSGYGGRDRERENVVLARSWRAFPESPSYASNYASILHAAGAWAELAAAAAEMAEEARPSLVRIVGYRESVRALHHLGRHDEAIRLERVADADTRGSGGGARLPYLSEAFGLHASVLREAGGDSALIAHARAVMTAADSESVAPAEGADFHTATWFRVTRAEGLLDKGELVASLREWDALASLADSLGASAFQSKVRVWRGRTLVKLGRTEEAELDLLAGLEAARRANHLQWQYEAEHNLLHLYEAAGRDEEARRAGEAFVALTQLGGLAPVQLIAHRDLAWFYLRRGEHERARAHFEAVVAYADSLPGYEYWAGEYFEVIGDLDGAVASYRKSRQSGAEGDARALAGLARLAEAMGDVDRAVRYARAYDESREVAGVPEYAPILPGLLARQGRVADAIPGLERARREASDRGQVAAWATLSAELAVLELRRGNLPVAASTADRAGEAAARVAADEVALRARAIAGLARARVGGPRRAVGLASVRAARTRAERMRVPQLEAEIGALYGEALAATGRPREALATLQRAADLTDSIAVSLALDPTRSGYRAAQSHVSNVALAVAVDRAGESWARERYADWSLRRKSRGVLERGTRRPAPSLSVMQRSLGPDQAVIDYVVLDSAVAALVITDRGVVLQRLPVRADTLRSRVEGLLSRLAPRIGTRVDTAHSFFDVALAERLYADLLAPLERVLADRTRLVIVADGPLHLLPLDALVSATTPQVTYAVDRYEITVVPSLAALGESRAATLAGPVVAVAGPGLEGTEPELAALGVAFGSRGVNVLRGDRASESQVRLMAPTAGLLHFAAHARPNDAEPSYARLTLAPTGDDDGQLHAYEIETLHLPGTLVVLSACETGAGRLLAGEGVLSLSRAFLRAGASGTVATLWPVGPATADLMGAFYPALARGEAPAAALRQAKLVLRQGEWASPFHWAGFTLVARGSPAN